MDEAVEEETLEDLKIGICSTYTFSLRQYLLKAYKKDLKQVEEMNLKEDTSLTIIGTIPKFDLPSNLSCFNNNIKTINQAVPHVREFFKFMKDLENSSKSEHKRKSKEMGVAEGSDEEEITKPVNSNSNSSNRKRRISGNVSVPLTPSSLDAVSPVPTALPKAGSSSRKARKKLILDGND